MVDRWELKGAAPTPGQLAQLQELLAKVSRVVREFQNLQTFVTKPYAEGAILDLEESRRANLPPMPNPTKREPG